MRKVFPWDRSFLCGKSLTCLEIEFDPLQRTADSGRPFEEPLRARPKQRPEVSQRGPKGGRRKLSGPRHQHEQTGREIFGQVHQ